MKKVAVWGLIAAALAAGATACTTEPTADAGSPAKHQPKAAETSKSPEEQLQEEQLANPEPKMSAAVENAVEAAEMYLQTMPFSKSGLIEQLKYEGYSSKDAAKAADAVEVDWNEQAVKTAKAYLKQMPFSRSDLVSQLEHDGFTSSQAEYGVKKAY
jgi:DNA-directed RNA polymerase specialized sigma54-like protein